MSDLNLKQALLELLKVVKNNHYTKSEEDNKLSLKVDNNTYQLDIDNLKTEDEELLALINQIKELIPNQASSTNQLADKDFVNSSISTATATFRGTYTSINSFPSVGIDSNDYLFYDTIDGLGNRKFDKYKYSNGEWKYEYTLNNSSFTEEQWKSINSGATIELINKILTNEENINSLNNTKLDKTKFNDFKNENTNVLNTKVDKEDGKGLSTIDFTDTNYVHTDNNYTNEEKEKLNGIEANAQVNTITGVKGSEEISYRTGNVSISKENIGLGNVDNTSDLNKPISTDTQKALDKTLYNLGAFDTVTDNEDGTVTITRQTGYLKIEASNITTLVTGGGTGIKGAKISLSKTIVNSVYYEWGAINGKSDIGMKVACYSEYWRQSNTINLSNEDATICKDGLSTLEDYKALCPINIQYKMATSYEEKVIKNQSLITLDQNGSNWLREEWEKGLNLADFPNRTGRWWVTKQDDISEFINQLPNGTYNISADCTPLSIDIGNVTDFFFWLQIYGGQYSSDDGIHTEIGNFTALNQTHRGYLTFTKQSYTNYVFRLWGFGNHDGGNHGEGKCSNIMLNEGNHAYTYQPYDYSGHIENEQGRYLIEKEEEARNLIDKLWINYEVLETTLLINIYFTKGTYICSQWGANITQGNAWQIFIDDNLIGTQLLLNGSSITFTIDKTGYHKFYMYCNYGGLSGNAVWTLNKGTRPLPYTPYNSKAHITNYETDFLKEEGLKSANLLNENTFSVNTNASVYWICEEISINAIPSGTYSISFNKPLNLAVYLYDSNNNELLNRVVADGTLTFTLSTNATKLSILNRGSTINDTLQIMLNKGSTALPYQEYNGSIIREKEFNEKLDELKSQINEINNSIISALEGEY